MRHWVHRFIWIWAKGISSVAASETRLRDNKMEWRCWQVWEYRGRRGEGWRPSLMALMVYEAESWSSPETESSVRWLDDLVDFSAPLFSGFWSGSVDGWLERDWTKVHHPSTVRQAAIFGATQPQGTASALNMRMGFGYPGNSKTALLVCPDLKVISPAICLLTEIHMVNHYNIGFKYAYQNHMANTEPNNCLWTESLV